MLDLMHARLLLTALCLLVMRFTEMSCRPAVEGRHTEAHAIYLNQSLLKEAVPVIAKI